MINDDDGNEAPSWFVNLGAAIFLILCLGLVGIVLTWLYRMVL